MPKPAILQPGSQLAFFTTGIERGEKGYLDYPALGSVLKVVFSGAKHLKKQPFQQVLKHALAKVYKLRKRDNSHESFDCSCTPRAEKL